MDSNSFDSETDIARFLEKFNGDGESTDFSVPLWAPSSHGRTAAPARQDQYNQSFEKLEEKISELEEKFAASTAQNQAVMQELARTRQAVENQKSRDAFFANITATIANLKESVENLSRARQMPRLYDPAPAPGRAFDAPSAGDYWAQSAYQPDNYRTAQAPAGQPLQTPPAGTDLHAFRAENERLIASWQQEREATRRELESAKQDNTEKERLISSLQQKASQLKAVNVALDREIKRAQQERTEALRKSAEQAKEILSLRDALTAAEERFKSFNFEGRIISVKRQYEQKVNKLETELHEISATCMRQVEEIESLKNENLKLHRVAEEREQLAALYEAKTRELETLRASLTQLQTSSTGEDSERITEFKRRMQVLQAEHDTLSKRLMQAQEQLKNVQAEKQTLKENFKVLLAKIEQNDAIIEDLKHKIAVLTEENRELKNAGGKKTLKRVHTAKPPQAEAKKTPRAVHPPQTAPVEMQPAAQAPVQTEADLPEIRVADPVPQEALYNGEDFLEKTDSFIGRMRWSIFREDK